MRLIDADALYEKLKEDEDLARQRVIDTPNSFPNGSLNPSAIRYMAQLSERTRFKETIYDAPTIEPERKTGHWIPVTNGRGGHECDICYDYAPSYQNGDEYLAKYCPNCGAKMEVRE